MKSNSKKWVFAIVALILGYFIGGLLGFPPTVDSLTSGDIAKVNKYQKSTVSPQVSAFQEKILNDDTELQKALAALTVINSRMKEFNTLTNASIDAASKFPELQGSVEKLKSSLQTSLNAVANGDAASESFAALLNKDSKSDVLPYDQASQNMVLSYMLLNNQISLGKDYVEDVDNFLKTKKSEDFSDLAATRDLWGYYCTVDALIKDDDSEVSYWNEKNRIASDAAVSEVCKAFPALQGYQGVDQMLIISSVPQLSGYTRAADYVPAEGGRHLVFDATQLGDMPAMVSDWPVVNELPTISDITQILSNAEDLQVVNEFIKISDVPAISAVPQISDVQKLIIEDFPSVVGFIQETEKSKTY